MIALGGIFVGLASLGCFAHYTSVAWPSIAYRPEIARPLRLDRPDSFGHCMMVTLLALSTGVSLLIYQLRRYRNDDFKGHYRLWRIVIIAMALASINAMVGVIDWAGALLDAMFGKRVALTGSDWVRLVVSLAGTVLAIRLIAEVRRCRTALAMMIAACLLFGLPEAAKWNVMDVDSLARWVAVTSAPLLASTALFLSLMIYLRMLYREVRQIEDGDSLLQRIQQLRAQWWSRDREDRADEEARDDSSSQKVAATRGDKPETKDREARNRSWWRRRSKPKRSVTRNNVTDERAPQKESEIEQEEVEQPSSTAKQPRATEAEKKETTKPRRRWFGLRSPKPPASQQRSQSNEDRPDDRDRQESKTAPVAPRKRSRFSLRLKPQAAATTPQSSSESATPDDSEASNDSAKKRGSGRGWFGRGAAKPSPQPDEHSSSSAAANRTSQAAGESTDEAEIDPENIDWNSLNKSERRRLRKQLKRQNRAA